MTKYEKAAAKAVHNRLHGEKEPVTLYGVCCTADSAVSDAGKKRELYDSLYTYADLLPAGWSTRWLSAEGCSGSMLYATPPGWHPGDSHSRSLLLGGGKLVQGEYYD